MCEMSERRSVNVAVTEYMCGSCAEWDCAFPFAFAFGSMRTLRIDEGVRSFSSTLRSMSSCRVCCSCTKPMAYRGRRNTSWSVTETCVHRKRKSRWGG